MWRKFVPHTKQWPNGSENMKKILFVITQFYKGGAEVALLNLFRELPQSEYEVDFLIFDQMILKDAQSLIPHVPSWIHVCNAAEKEGKCAVIKKAWFKAYKKITKHQLYRKSAYEFVKNKQYDVAFSYGEWMSPEFVATKVNATKKMVWIHADIDKANYVDERILFGYDNRYDGYIFVSEYSRLAGEHAFPLLKGRSYVVHNMCDDDTIRRLALESISDEEIYPKPWVVSVANLREEKNYPRMLETMKCLKERGIDIRWLCIGSTANPFLLNKIKTMIVNYGLQDTFILMGTDQNPYRYMAKSCAVLVLSDFESWSLVITEAKLLQIPVIATRTSGALEQIEDNKTGRFVSFEPVEIADVIEEYLGDSEIRNKMSRRLEGFSTNNTTLREFYDVIGDA